MAEEKKEEKENIGAIEVVDTTKYFSDYRERFDKLGQSFPDKYWPTIEEKHQGHELAELENQQMSVTDYPHSVKRYYLEFLQSTDAVEPLYYQAHQIMRDLGYGNFIKVTDVFAASEQSSLYGAAAQRLGLAQDRVAQYLRVINDMVKGMFQIIRELRILDERLAYYEGSRSKGARGEQAEVSLKGLWIDLVEGGAKNPGSVLGLSQQLGFTILPDLFFRTNRTPLEAIADTEEDAAEKRAKDLKEKNTEIAERVKDLPYNEKVKEVLGRKLTQFYIWKDSTEKELSVRRTFMIKYFRQYYSTIKLYMSWTRPYLKLLKRLQLDISMTSDAQLISAFEGSMIEIEILCKRRVTNDNPFYSIILLTFEHATQPKLSFAAEGGFHRGPLHTGRTFVTWRGYNWTDDDINRYLKYRESKDFELLASVDGTLKAALDAVEGDIRKYLEDLGEIFEKKNVPIEKKKESLDLMDPLVSVVKGLWEPWEESKETSKGWREEFKEWFRERLNIEGKEKIKVKDQFSTTNKVTMKQTYNHYKLFKQAHGILAW